MIYLRNLLLKVALPITKFFGKLHMPFSHKKITGKHYFDILPKLKPGMIFLTKIDGEFSNLFIPGEYSHSAIYAGNNVVIEAIGKGVIKKDLVTFMLSKDYIKVRKHKFSKDETIGLRAVDFAKYQIGAPYDFNFLVGNKAWYCFELVYYCFKFALKTNPFELRKTWGAETITGVDLNNTDKFETVWCSKEVEPWQQ